MGFVEYSSFDGLGLATLDLGHIVEEGKLDIDPLAFGRDFFLFVCVAMAADIDGGSKVLGRTLRSS
jgi:hypothetical protein